MTMTIAGNLDDDRSFYKYTPTSSTHNGHKLRQAWCLGLASHPSISVVHPPPHMASFQIAPFAGLLENTEFTFRSLYLHNISSGPNPTRGAIINDNVTTGWGHTFVVDWTIYDGTGPGAKLIGHAQGQQIYASKWSHSVTLEFTNGRYGCVHVIFIFHVYLGHNFPL